jgi:hypothetical protein
MHKWLAYCLPPNKCRQLLAEAFRVTGAERVDSTGNASAEHAAG